MNASKLICSYRRLGPAVRLILLATAALPANADPTVWTGPTINFVHDDAGGAEDAIIPGAVVITRGSSGGLYNAATESSASAGFSPADTEWAMGDLSDYNTLSYSPCPLEAHNSPAGYIGTAFVVHLINEDIYLSLTLSAWGGQGGSGPFNFSYTRSTAPAALPTPTVSLTGPANGTVLAAPASLKLTASASVSSGTVTNVEFFANGNSLGSVTSAPFNLASAPLGTNTYAITAVATAAGVSATSSPPVTVTVVSPVTNNLSFAPGITNGKFLFTYSATPGLTYVVQSSSNLSTWVPVITNIPSSSSVPVTNNFKTNVNAYFRVVRLPNP